MQVKAISYNVNFEDSKSSMEIGDECPGIAKIKETTEQVRFRF
jgi:hypothetical protein